MRILIAMNAFKGSARADELGEAIADGLRAARFRGSIRTFPIADGGDGTLEVMACHWSGEYKEGMARTPLGKESTCAWLYVKNKQAAVIEMAKASGLHWLADRKPEVLNINSFGTGQQIQQAFQCGSKRIFLGLGGSATVDGGLGILQALGFRFLDPQGKSIDAKPANFLAIHEVLPPENGWGQLKSLEINLLCDVDNPLLGEKGAARVFGPQKGARPEEVEVLERGLSHWAERLEVQSGKKIKELPGTGAAGGIAVGILSFFQGEILNGFDFMSQEAGLEKQLAESDWLITGEGRLDLQSLAGKGPYAMASLAKKMGCRCIALVGSYDRAIVEATRDVFQAIWPIGVGPESVEEAMRNSLEDARKAGFYIGSLWVDQ